MGHPNYIQTEYCFYPHLTPLWTGKRLLLLAKNQTIRKRISEDVCCYGWSSASKPKFGWQCLLCLTTLNKTGYYRRQSMINLSHNCSLYLMEHGSAWACGIHQHLNGHHRSTWLYEVKAHARHLQGCNPEMVYDPPSTICHLLSKPGSRMSIRCK